MMSFTKALRACCCGLALTGPLFSMGALAASEPWRDPNLSPDLRADAVLQQLKPDEKFQLVFGYFGSVKDDVKFMPPADARMGSAGYVPGIARLGIPAQWITDAGMGVATQRESADAYRERTALPSGLAVAASFNPEIAAKGGAMIGREARASGFNVLLAGGVDLIREPRNGRNFEYAGEDPLLAGTIVGASVKGIQSEHVISTVKHWALNAQETGRGIVSSDIEDSAARQSDFLAFQIAIEQGAPGSVMCSYNKVNTVYACENDYLLNQVLKRDFAYPGYVMSDWGAVHSTEASALAGLDQESAGVFDNKLYFDKMLKDAVAAGRVPQARVDDMARRILRSMFAAGAVDHPVGGEAIDFTANRQIAAEAAEEGIVLLKNSRNVLPLAKTAKRIVIIGGHADRGVISGGGSSTVFPAGGNAVPGLGPQGWPGPIVYLPSAPMAAMMARAPMADVKYFDGKDQAAAAKAAAKADVVVVFATQWASEDMDLSLTLADNQDDLIRNVAAANPNTVVVLETGGAVLMPWIDKVSAVVEAWMPGSGGGEAIARVLFGEVDASGRLPVSFPQSLAQLPRQKIDGVGLPKDTPFSVNYSEGAAVGYKWYEKNGQKPLFAFGYGLSYTSFAYSDLKAATVNGKVTVSFTVKNTGARAGKDVPQVYVSAAEFEAPKRLAGFTKVALQAGQATQVTLTLDPRLISTYDSAAKSWKKVAGPLTVSLGASSADIKAKVTVTP
ncbi:beta-glucosidase [Rhizomicrobium palustre]|uniref:Beta-glucosidase n=1 Tax=Rhizomicrobium palustre TaxID=189966 RepID=A0A846N077_9PROT|nr:glycoside hydrolase family 3 protein [Rhizomicrobium palustre]NIK88895.1 beta-glucosidase [Rhizomicrobium palustre]